MPSGVPSESGQHPGLLAGWQHSAPAVDVDVPNPMVRANSFGRRRALSFNRKPRRSGERAEAPAPPPPVEPDVVLGEMEVPVPLGPSRGGRLRSAKPKADPPAEASTNGNGAARSVLRRPSFSRKRNNKTETALPLPVSRPDPAQPPPLEVALPGERNAAQGGQKLRTRAASFTRMRRKPGTEENLMPQAQPSSSSPGSMRSAQSAATLPFAPPVATQLSGRAVGGPPPADVAAPKPPSLLNPEGGGAKAQRSSSFGRRLARRASSFTRRGGASNGGYSDV